MRKKKLDAALLKLQQEKDSILRDLRRRNIPYLDVTNPQPEDKKPRSVKTGSKPCLKRPLKKNTKIGFQVRLSLNAGQKYCKMLLESIQQYFRPSLSYHLSLRPLFAYF